MALRNNQYVGRRLRISVFEREDVLVFVDLFRGDFAADDAAEDATGVGRHKSTCARKHSKGVTGLSACPRPARAGLGWNDIDRVHREISLTGPGTPRPRAS